MVDSSLPGSPLVCTITTPGSLPASELDTLIAGELSSTGPCTAVTAPVTVAFF